MQLGEEGLGIVNVSMGRNCTERDSSDECMGGRGRWVLDDLSMDLSEFLHALAGI